MIKYNILLSFFLLFTFSGFSQDVTGCDDPACRVDSLVLNTGYDHQNQTSLNIGVNDPQWTLMQAPDTSINLPAPAWVISNQGWANPGPNAEWISAYQYQDWAQNNHYDDPPPSNLAYRFQYCFCVCQEVRSIEIDMELFADNNAYVIFDQDTILTFPDSNSVDNFRDGISLTQRFEVEPGEHCLRIDLRNNSAVAMGLMVRGAITGISGGGMQQPVMISQACCDPSGSIVGRKINDTDCDSTNDNTSNNPNIDPGLQGWEITLNPGNITKTTDANGYFSFTGLTPGTYTVSETLQSGWNQTIPGTNSYLISLDTNETEQLIFANCEDTTKCDDQSQGKLDTSCCLYTFSLGNSGGAVTSIDYNVSGGTMESIYATPCNYTTVPPQVFGTTNGTINYSPSCSDPQNFEIEATPATASGQIIIDWTVHYEEGEDCHYTDTLACERAPLERCDSLRVTTFYEAGINQSGRTFYIYNEKIPTSAICSVSISPVPPPASGLDGGGLKVDGTPSGNFVYPYTSIDLSSNPAQNLVQFNLAIDTSINWTGDIDLTVYHCDGDSCMLSYDDWDASISDDDDGGVIIADPIDVDLEPSLIALDFGGLTVNDNRVEYIDIMIRKGAERISAISAPKDGTKLSEDQMNYIENSSIVGSKTAHFEIKLTKNTDKASPKIYLVCMSDPDNETNEIVYEYILSDENANTIGTVLDTVEAKSVGVLEQPEGMIQGKIELLKSSPNPAQDITTVHYLVQDNMNIKLELYNMQGQKIKTIKDGFLKSGIHQTEFSTNGLPSGSYIIKLSNGNELRSLNLRITK